MAEDIASGKIIPLAAKTAAAAQAIPNLPTAVESLPSLNNISDLLPGPVATSTRSSGSIDLSRLEDLMNEAAGGATAVAAMQPAVMPSVTASNGPDRIMQVGDMSQLKP